MAYIGRPSIVGNFVKLDAISVVNGQAAYTMQNSSANFTDYSSVNQFMVSLNGTIQSPGSSFTVSGSTITFASNLVTNDVIDFIIVFGNSLSSGVPTDATVSTAKIVDGAITSVKLASGVGGVAGITSSADATAMTITSAEKIGIGETTPLALVHIKQDDSGQGTVNADTSQLVIEDNSTAGITLLGGTSGTGAIFFGDSGDNDVGLIEYDHGANSMVFKTNGYEKMNIGSSTTSFHSNGTVTVEPDYAGGGTARPRLKIGAFASNGSDGGVDFSTFNSSGNSVKINYSTARSGGTTAIEFHNPNGSVGGIDTNGSNTSYNTSSDYRLKENISYDFDATTRLKQLKPARFNFIADPDTTVDGFIAHEAQLIVPEAVTKEQDAMKTEEYEVTPAVLDDDGSVITEAVIGTREVPDYQGIDQSKLVPLLVKTIQELEARITELENA